MQCCAAKAAAAVAVGGFAVSDGQERLTCSCALHSRSNCPKEAADETVAAAETEEGLKQRQLLKQRQD
jgi:hypothetical protein